MHKNETKMKGYHLKLPGEDGVKENTVRVMYGKHVAYEFECKDAAKAYISDQFYIDSLKSQS